MNPSLFAQRSLDAALRSDFPSFIEKVVGIVNPSETYQDNWHIWAIAWHVEQVLQGKIRRLVICLPPRSLKSLIASVALPAWALGRDPTRKIVSITYSNLLAAKHANDFRMVVNSPTFQRVFPHARVARHKDTEVETVFTAGGYRYATSTTGTVTGRGGDLLICDDPIKAQDVFSDTKRDATNQLFRNTIASRLDNKQTGGIIVVMQRLHANDFVGSLLQSSEGWTVLNLPAIAEQDERIQVGDNTFHFRKAGEPLHAEREPLSVLHKTREEVGPDTWNAQYQQAPVPPGGVIIRREWIRYHNIETPAPSYRREIFQSIDTAGKAGPRNSYTVITTWLKENDNYYLLDLVRGRFDFPTLLDTAINCIKKHKPQVVLVEDASTGTALAPVLSKAGACRVEAVTVQLDKVSRLFLQQAKFASGRVFFPEKAPFLAELLRELLCFPQSPTSDQVDSISQALAHEGSGYDIRNVLGDDAPRHW